MKKYAKTLTLVLSCILILCCVLSISSSANTEPSVRIAKKNISYDDAPRIVYAVEAENIGEDDIVKILFSYSEISAPAVGATLEASDDEYINDAVEEKIIVGGTEYYAVFSNGTAPADMRTPIFAVPVVVDENNTVLAVGDSVEYSIFTYVTNMLRRGASVEQEVLFTTLLDMGAAVQKVLIDSGIPSAVESANKFGYADEYYDFLAYRGQGANKNEAQNYTGVTSTPSNMILGDGGITGNIGDANWTAILDNQTDAYINIGRNGGSEGSTVTFKASQPAYNIDKQVFETDIMWNGGNAAVGTCPINLRFNGSATHIQYTSIASNGALEINGAGITLQKHIWYNIRVEIEYISDDKAELKWYLNNELTATVEAAMNAHQFSYVQFEIRKEQFCAGNSVLDIAFDNSYISPVYEDYRGKGDYSSLAQSFTGLTALPTNPYKITSLDSGLKGSAGDANWTAIVDGSTDAYLDIGRNGGTTGSTPLFWFTKITGTEKYVFESDIKWGGCNAASGAYPINLKFNDGTNTVTYTMYVNANGDLYTNKNGVNATLAKDLWFNLRIEITYVSDTEATFSWYLNGTEVGSQNLAFNAKNSNWVQFEIRGSQYCAGNDVFNISFDNVYTAPYHENYRGKGEYVSSAINFTDRTSLPTVPYKITSLDGGLKGNVGDENWTSILDNATDAYLDIGRNGGTTNSTPLFWFAKDETATTYVFETDIKWGGCNAAAWSNPMNIVFSDGTNSLAYKMFTNAAGELYTNQNGVNATFATGFWYNLRVEITYVSDTEATFAWYLNGEAVGTYSATFNAKNATSIKFEIRGSQYCAGNDVFNISFDNVYTSVAKN